MRKSPKVVTCAHHRAPQLSEVYSGLLNRYLYKAQLLTESVRQLNGQDVQDGLVNTVHEYLQPVVHHNSQFHQSRDCDGTQVI